jgi:hypothetical protein
MVSSFQSEDLMGRARSIKMGSRQPEGKIEGAGGSNVRLRQRNGFKIDKGRSR